MTAIIWRESPSGGAVAHERSRLGVHSSVKDSIIRFRDQEDSAE